MDNTRPIIPQTNKTHSSGSKDMYLSKSAINIMLIMMWRNKKGVIKLATT